MLHSELYVSPVVCCFPTSLLICSFVWLQSYLVVLEYVASLAQFHATCMDYDGPHNGFACLECACRLAAKNILNEAVSCIQLLEEVMTSADRLAPPPLESLTAEVEATPEHLKWCVCARAYACVYVGVLVGASQFVSVFLFIGSFLVVCDGCVCARAPV